MAAENVKTESNAKVEAKTEARAFIINLEKEKIARKPIELIGKAAAAKMEKTTAGVFKYNSKSGKIQKKADELNEKMLSTRQEVIKSINQKADAEARLEAKYTSAKISGGNNNILAIKLQQLMSRATDPETINPILESANLEITNFRNETNARADQIEETKAKPLNVKVLTKDELAIIGKNYKNYRRQNQEQEEVKQEAVEEDILTKSKKAIKQAGWLKAFKGVAKKTTGEEHDKSKITDIKRELDVQMPMLQDNEVTNDELRRRKLIGEAGEGIEQINRLEISLGENELINQGLRKKKKDLKGIVKELGKCEIESKDIEVLIPEKTEFQETIDKAMNISEAPTKEEHDRLERELNEYYSDPFHIAQLERQKEEAELYYYNNPEVAKKLSEAERVADRELSAKLRGEAALIDEATLVNNALTSTVEQDSEGSMVIKKHDAEIQANMLHEKNLVADAVEEVTQGFRQKAEKEIKEQKELHSGARMLAEDLMQKNLVVDAVAEVTQSYINGVNNMKKEENELHEGAVIQAEDLYQKNLVADAVAEVTQSYKDEYIKQENEQREIHSGARMLAEDLMQKNLAATAVEEVTESVKKQIEEEKKAELTQEEMKRSAEKEARILHERNTVIDSARKDVEDHREEIVEQYAKEQKAFRIIRNAQSLISQRKLKEGAKLQARRIMAKVERANLVDDAQKTAQKIFVNNIKYDADLLAQKIHLSNIKDDANKQAQLLFLDDLKNAAEIQAEMMIGKADQQEEQEGYVVTSTNARYVRETSEEPKAAKLPNSKFTSLANNSRRKSKKADDKAELEGLKGQLVEINFGEEEDEKVKTKAA